MLLGASVMPGDVLPYPGRMVSHTEGLVEVDVPVTDLQVEAAVRIGADPSFVMDCRSLASEIR